MKRNLGFVIVSACCSAAPPRSGYSRTTPRHTGDFPKPCQALARCVFERLDAQTGRSVWGGLPAFIYRLDDQPDERRGALAKDKIR